LIIAEQRSNRRARNEAAFHSVAQLNHTTADGKDSVFSCCRNLRRPRSRLQQYANIVHKRRQGPFASNVAKSPGSDHSIDTAPGWHSTDRTSDSRCRQEISTRRRDRVTRQCERPRQPRHTACQRNHPERRTRQSPLRLRSSRCRRRRSADRHRRRRR
jgi:hypothetical protein